MGQVPAEYRGQARQFRLAMLACDLDYERAVKAIVAPLKARLRRKPTLRREHVIDTVRAWKALPHRQYQLRPVETLHESEDELEIAEVRLAAGRILNPDWDSDELGLIVTRVGLRVANGRLAKSLQGSVVISGHALGRRFERVRAADRSADAVIADIDALVGRADNVRGWRGVDFVANDYGTARQMRDIRTWWWHPD